MYNRSLRTVPETPSFHHCPYHRLTTIPRASLTPDSYFMISTACYPYPVSDKSSARRVALQPHIYSPSESHDSPRITMYPPLSSPSPSSSYIYSGYEQYYPKDNWLTPTPGSWSSFYPRPPRSSSLPESSINPKVIVHPPQPVLASDIDTPSSTSSHSILTPPSPFTHYDVDQAEFQPMDFDEFECEEEDYVDSDYADEMEGIDGASPSLYGAPHVIKSTSALEGALGDTQSSYDTHLGVFEPADRRLSASVPGYPSASHRSSTTAHSPTSHLPVTSSSTSLFAPTLPASPASSLPLYNHMSSSSSLAGAFASSVSSPHASRPTPNPLPILQPQPIRPIPPIPLADLTSSASEGSSSPEPRISDGRPTRTLSPLPLLCQPVSDAVRYQLKERPASGGALDDIDYDGKDASESMCQSDIAATGGGRFAQGLMFCQEHQPTAGPYSVGGKLYSCGSIMMPLSFRWQ